MKELPQGKMVKDVRLKKLRNQGMRLRNNKSISSISTTFQETPSSRKRKCSSNLDDYNEINVSRSSKRLSGVARRKSGKYGVKIYDRLRRKDTWLGTFDTEEEASKVYLSKKKELEEEAEGLPKHIVRGDGERTSRFVGVSRISNGKFAAHIRDPIRRKKLHLGYFESEEEASEVYLAKKAVLAEEVKGVEGIRWMSKRVCRKARRPLEIKKNVEEFGQCREEDSSGNQESNMEIDNLDAVILEDDLDARVLEDDLDTWGLEDNSLTLEENDDGPGVEDNQESSKKIDDSDCLLISEVNNDDSCLEDNQESAKKFDYNENNDRPDSDNQESSKKLDNTDSLPVSKENGDDLCSDNQESSSGTDYLAQTENALVGVSEKSSVIQETENSANKELILVESSVQTLINYERCAGAKILLRTESGTPVMDSHGFLLGRWSCIDDLTLNF